MSYLSPLDAAFLRMESVRTPMHVGSLMTFQLPEDAPPDFLHRLLDEMRKRPFMPEPFGSRLKEGRLARIAPSWEPAKVDMDYHLRHSALPYPGGERELGILVSRLHSHPLDFSRPLWECHVIEGLAPRPGQKGGRFAMYFKAHHCAIDGMGAIRMMQKWLSTDPESSKVAGPWVLAAKPPEPSRKRKQTLMDRLRAPAKAAADQARGFRELVKGLRTMTAGADSGARMAMSTPRSLFNQKISQQRRLGTQILELPRLKAVADAVDVTINDVLLAVVGGAARRYLLELKALPEKSLLASVPVGLQRPDGKPGNAAAGFVAPLGTELADPVERLKWIKRVTERSKRELQALPPAALNQLALLGISPMLLGQMAGVLPRLPPIFNFVVSNVVLAKKALFLMGAELEAMYPVSFLFDGYAINITLVGYNDKVAIGVLGCREAVPSLQRLAVYMSDSLAELEAATVVGRRARSRPARGPGPARQPGP